MSGPTAVFRPVAGGLLLALALSAAAGDRLSVELFIDSQAQRGPWASLAASHPELDLTVYDLAAPRQLAAQLSAGLPRDPGAAKQLASERIQAQKDQLAGQLKAAYAGLSRAMALGLNRTPAIVVNGEAVLYGSADLDAGLQHYRHWQETRQP